MSVCVENSGVTLECGFGVQEPSWFEALLGPACARATHKDHRATRKDRGCVQEALECVIGEILRLHLGTLSYATRFLVGEK